MRITEEEEEEEDRQHNTNISEEGDRLHIYKDYFNLTNLFSGIASGKYTQQQSILKLTQQQYGYSIWERICKRTTI